MLIHQCGVASCIRSCMLFYGLICRFTASPMQHSKLPWFTLLPLSSRALKKANAQLYQPVAQRKGTPLCPTCCFLGNSGGKYGLASFQVLLPWRFVGFWRIPPWSLPKNLLVLFHFMCTFSLRLQHNSEHRLWSQRYYTEFLPSEVATFSSVLFLHPEQSWKCQEKVRHRFMELELPSRALPHHVHYL